MTHTLVMMPHIDVLLLYHRLLNTFKLNIGGKLGTHKSDSSPIITIISHSNGVERFSISNGDIGGHFFINKRIQW